MVSFLSIVGASPVVVEMLLEGSLLELRWQGLALPCWFGGMADGVQISASLRAWHYAQADLTGSGAGANVSGHGLVMETGHMEATVVDGPVAGDV